MTRPELVEATNTVEGYLARPALGPMWASRVSEALCELRAAFADHVADVARPGGPLSQVVNDAPRLANSVSWLHTQHSEIDVRISDVVDLICARTPDCDHTEIEHVRVETVEVLSRIWRYQQAGSELVYEAYHVDIGGG